MSPLARNRLTGFALALAIFAIDQWVKAWVTGPLGIDRLGDFMEVLPFFDLRFVQNYGISLGMFQATSPEMQMALIGMTSLIALVVTVWMVRETALLDILALAMILGGAIGNIRDRYLNGYVIDYADLHFGEFRPFMIFNVADAAITIGVVIILVRSFLLSKKDTDDSQETAQGAAERPNA